MDTYFRVTLLACLFHLAVSQYGPQYHRQEQPQHSAPAAPSRHYAPDPYLNKPVTPQPLIISHKQALTHDGGFNFAFAADNGLQQGESIAPDGTRKGGYSYVDPNGKKITIRYTAGKDGFRILEGDHIPRAPQPVAQQAPQPQYQQQYAQPAPQLAYSSPQTFASPNLYRRPVQEDDGQYRESYDRPQQYVATTPASRYGGYKGQASQANALQQEPDYNDEPGKPHSFGHGYAFEFSG